MSKPFNESLLCDQLDQNLTYRLKELSDLKQTIRDASELSRTVLLKSLVTMAYAHWEGYIKFSAQKYFEYISARKHLYRDLQPNFYRNSFLVRLAALSVNRTSLQERAALIDEIIETKDKRFSYLNKDLINTGSNLKFEVFSDICFICGVDAEKFKSESDFIDVQLLKRRNAIAHGDGLSVNVSYDEIDDFISRSISLMRQFKDEIENKVVLKDYLLQ